MDSPMGAQFLMLDGGQGSPRTLLKQLQTNSNADPRLQRIVLLGPPESQARLLYHYLKKFGLLDQVKELRLVERDQPPAAQP